MTSSQPAPASPGRMKALIVVLASLCVVLLAGLVVVGVMAFGNDRDADGGGPVSTEQPRISKDDAFYACLQESGLPASEFPQDEAVFTTVDAPEGGWKIRGTYYGWNGYDGYNQAQYECVVDGNAQVVSLDS